MRFKHHSLAAAAVLVGALPATAAAAPFTAPTPLAGFGDQPQLAGLSDSAVAVKGASIVAGTRSIANRRQVVAALGAPGQSPATTRPLHGTGDITSQPQVAIADNGAAAVTWSEGHTAFLARCRGGSCGTAVTVGRSALNPEPAVAVEPDSGRITVLWRGRAGRANRLQWRITTNGRLGRVHSLGELGNDPQLGTDASGKSVAVWSRFPSSSRAPLGLRTAARRVGEFTRPATLATGRVRSPRLATGAGGRTFAAWVAPDGRAVLASSRTAGTSFTRPQTLVTGDARTVDVGASPGGRGALAIGRGTDASQVTVAASVAASGGAFSAPVAVSPPQFISDADPARAAITAGGTTTIAWIGQPSAGGQAPAGSFAAIAPPGGAFSAPQAIASPATVAAGGATLAAGG